MTHASRFCIVLLIALLSPQAWADFGLGDSGLDPDFTLSPPNNAPTPPELLAALREEVVERAIFRREARYHVRTLARHHRSRDGIRPPRIQPPTEAGDWFESLELAIDTNYASVHDGQLGGSGHEGQTTFTLTANIGDEWQLSLSHALSRVDIGGATPLEENANNTTLMVSYLATEKLTLGAFVSFTQTDIEEQDVDDVWGAGLLASYGTQIKGFDVGVTGTLASLNDNDSLADIFDSQDAVGAVLFDVSRSLSDSVSATVFAGLYSALNNKTESDQTFWTTGADITYAPNDVMAVGLGYERTLDLENFQDHRINASIAVNW
jgi:hypothetical protein